MFTHIEQSRDFASTADTGKSVIRGPGCSKNG